MTIVTIDWDGRGRFLGKKTRIPGAITHLHRAFLDDEGHLAISWITRTQDLFGPLSWTYFCTQALVWTCPECRTQLRCP